MELVRFYSWVLKIAILLALAGQLQNCTLQMLGFAANATKSGMISYSKYTRLLTK